METGQTDIEKTGDTDPVVHSGASSEEFFEAINTSQLQTPLAAHIDRFERLELPPFWSQQVQLWFAAVEAQFQLRKITADATKYYAVVARLDQDAPMIVGNIVANPPLSDKYIALKEALVDHFEIPQDRRFKMLLSGIELRERGPTELLAEINRLGGNNLDPSFVRSMWLNRLPLQIQLALTATGEQDNAKLAQTANRLMAIQRDSENHCVMPIARETVCSGIQKQLDELAKQVEKLSQKLSRSTVGEDRQKRFNNSTNVSRSTTDNTSTSTCYYHRRFGERAKKCTQPCAFQGNANRPQ
ncbi:uncharacterized protein LOC128864870 [Anastrepha ludens]|uniref:uncharacterized protein LOC128864870 n=1 Tax=Anastrepha ludens TaxID=28586 RepID=UPI0023B0FB50|nr:uncharacterized protein LOC128864870 [Anastrepha ludens]